MLTETIEGFKLSLQQEHLWSLQQNSADQNYRVQCAILIEGNLELDLFKIALENIVARHEIFRTNFRFIPEIIFPVQTIAEQIKVLEESYDFSGHTPQQQAIEFEKIFEKIKYLPVDFEQGSLFKSYLITLSAQRYILIVSTSAMLADAKTLQNLVRELSDSYSACLQQNNNSSETLQYIDFAEWQNEILTAAETEIGRDYWHRQDFYNLEIKLPREREISEQSAFLPRIFTAKLTLEVSQRIKAIAQEKNTSVDNFLLACWQILLWRLTQQEEFTIGIGCAGREHSELEAALGLFAKYLPLSCHLSDELLFSQVLDRIGQFVTEVYRWQECFSWQETSKSDSQTLFFPVSFDFEEEVTTYSQDNVSFSLYKQFICIDRFNIRLSCRSQHNCIVTDFYYDSARFELEAIEELQKQFYQLVESAANNAEAKISALKILSDRTWQELLVKFNQTETEYPQDKCVHQLFESQVAKTPNAVAVVLEEQKLTYQELNTKANQLAHYLQKLGVKPEVLVGICVERSLEMVIALLAVLKAGGTYIPIEPSYPLERKTFILKDSQISVLLTQQHLITDLATETTKTICLDSDWQAINQQKKENPINSTTKLNLAYIIYTSGSTGKPKGTLITHQGLVNYLSWCTKTYTVEQGVGTLVHSPLGFDLTITSLLSPLLVGRTVELLPEKQGIEALPQALSKSSNLSLVKITPAHLDLLKQQLAKEEIANKTRAFIIGGDNLLAESISFWQDVAPETILVNEYGPTETVVGCCVYQVPVGKHSSGSIPIGKPIANTQLYILNKSLQPVPTGVQGELHIGGVGLARGYLNRAELTALKFIPNPFSQIEGDRLYKTGDLVCFLPSGEIEYLGRIDNQVKIRGFRIELGEIEAQIAQHPAVRETVVVTREDLANSQQVVAYVVAQQEPTLTIAALREFLASKLPSYMIPSAFVTLEALPLTPNGKVDRKALPAPDREIIREQEHVAPRTVTEETLVDIWQELLRKEKVSIHDNFFEIGGDSILSIQVISRAKNSGIQITTRQIFKYQTITELARVANTTVSVSVQQGIVTGTAPLTPIQHWFFAQNQDEAHHFNQSVLLHLPNDVKPQLLEKAVEKLLEHHDALRLRFKSQASEYKQINYDKEKNIPFSVVDLSLTPRFSQSQALSKIATECQASLNLSTGLIMRAVMFNLGSDSDARLLIVIHHLAVDAVSWRILLSDLQKIYQQIIAQQPIQLNAKTTAFIDWAEKLNNYAQSEILKQELNYWLNQPWSKTTPLPLDYACARQENTVGSAASVSVELSVEETRTLLESVNKAYNTQINDILLSALALSLAQWAENSTVVINLEGHGREELFDSVDLSRTVGWFTSLFPVLLQLPDLNQLAFVIKSIKEQLRTIPNRGIGYGVLRYLCKDTTVNQQLQTIPTPEISFNYLGQFDQVESQSDWKFASESTGGNRNSKQIRAHLLDVNALVIKGKLQINWTYSNNVHTQATLENLAQSYVQTIRSIIEHCQSKDTLGGYTPSDFPDIQLNQSELDELLENLHQ